jgi:von Willebrand factor type A domain
MNVFISTRSLGAVLLLASGCTLIHGKDSDQSQVSPSAVAEPPKSEPPDLAVTRGGAPGMASSPDAGTDDGVSQCGSLSGLSECGNTTVTADLRTVNILMVIDKSGSMTDEPSGFGTDKWSALKTALGHALNGVAADVNVGLLMYPYSTAQQIPLVCHGGCCEVPDGASAVNVDIDSGTRSLPRILAALDAVDPGGGTPTAQALARANDYFTTGAGAALKGNNYVLLATDGGPNCNSNNSCGADRCTTNLDGQCDSGNCCKASGEGCLDDIEVTGQLRTLLSHGVRTFVVGIPGTEAYSDYLDGFAVAGGEPNPATPPSYYAVSPKDGVQGLEDVFTGITSQLLRSCTIQLAEDPPKLELVNLAIDCEVIKPSAKDGSGWTIDTHQTPGSVVLSGPICDRVQRQGATRVDVVYGCPTVR